MNTNNNQQKKNIAIYHMNNYVNISGIRTRIIHRQQLSKTFKKRVTKSYRSGWNPNQNIINILDNFNLIIKPETGRLIKLTNKMRLDRIKSNTTTDIDLMLLDDMDLFYKQDTRRFIKRSRLNIYKKKGYKLDFDNRIIYKLNPNNKIFEYPITNHKSQPVGLVLAENDQPLYLHTAIKDYFRNRWDIIKNWESIIIIHKGLEQNIIIANKQVDIQPNWTFNKFWTEIYKKCFFNFSPDGAYFADVNNDNVLMIFASVVPFMDTYLEQVYADNLLSNCIPGPIINWLEQKIETSKAKSTIYNYKKIKSKAKIWQDNYKQGIPENKLQEFCNDLNIDLSITLPIGFSYNNSQLKPYKSYSTEKRQYGLKHFKFINTRFNHVDSLFCQNQNKEEIETKEEMESIMNNIRNEGRIIPYYKYNDIYNTIYDIDTVYTLKSSYFEAKEKFIKDNNLEYSIIDLNSKIGKFILNSVHFPACMDINNKYCVDNSLNDNFIDDLDLESWEVYPDQEFKECDFNNIQMWDMEKAYYNYKKCPYYDGFAINCYAYLNCEIPIQDAIKNEAGFYMIDNLDFTSAKKILERVNIFYNKMVVPHFVIKYLVDNNINFKIIQGVYATNGDIKCEEYLLEKEDGIRHYQKMFGAFVVDNDFSKISFDNTDKELLQTSLYQIKQQGIDARAVENKFTNTIDIHFKKKSVKNRAHISSYVYFYSMITVLEQCLLIDTEDILRINVDAIYFDNKQKYKNIEKVGTFENEPDREGFKSKKYISKNLNCIDKAMTPKYFYKFENNKIKTQYFINRRIRCLQGAGGTGKTYEIINNSSYEFVNYSAHSHKLCKAIHNQYPNKINYSAPYQHITSNNNRLKSKLLNNNGVFIFDEVSAYSYNDIKKIMYESNRYKLPFIFCGDIGYQTAPILDNKSDKDRLLLFKGNIEYRTKNYRFKDDPYHEETMMSIRTKMKSDIYFNKIMDYILHDRKYKKIERKEFIKNMNINDILLCSEHKFINEYNEILSKKFNKNKKWLCKSNNKDFSNGQIVISQNKIQGSIENYGYTIHSFQGETIKSPNKLYIDCRKLKNNNILYTALSRAKTKDQIYFIY